MLDQTTIRTDPLRHTDRWGAMGTLPEELLPIEEESEGRGRALLWVALLAIAVIVVMAVFAFPL
jgi:hypothetical protein